MSRSVTRMGLDKGAGKGTLLGRDVREWGLVTPPGRWRRPALVAPPFSDGRRGWNEGGRVRRYQSKDWAWSSLCASLNSPSIHPPGAGRVLGSDRLRPFQGVSRG